MERSVEPPDLADAFGDRVGHGVELLGLLVQQQVIVAEMRAAHVPVEILGFEVQSEHIREDAVHTRRDILRGFRAEIGGSNQGRCPTRGGALFVLQFFLRHGVMSVGG